MEERHVERKRVCLVVLPGTAETGHAAHDQALLEQLIDPALSHLGMERVDAKATVGANARALVDRLVLCDCALLVMSHTGPAMHYALGAREATHLPGTVILLSEDASPTDTLAMGRAHIYYRFDEQAQLVDADRQCQRLAAVLREAAGSIDEGRGLRLLQGDQDAGPAHLRTDEFQAHATYDPALKQALGEARRQGKAAVIDFETRVEPIEDAGANLVVDLMLAYRAVQGWDRLINLVERMPNPIRQTRLVREQYALALNRAGRSEQAEENLRAVIDEFGPSSETWGLLGRVYKDRWHAALAAGKEATAKGLLSRAVEAYLTGFDCDVRDAYPGVNAATLMELMDPPDERRSELRTVVAYSAAQRVESRQTDYWDWAALVELRVLARDDDGARDALVHALARMREAWEPLTTARNLRMIERAWRARGDAVSVCADVAAELEQAAREATPASDVTPGIRKPNAEGAPETTRAEERAAGGDAAVQPQEEKPVDATARATSSTTMRASGEPRAEVLVIGSGLGGGMLAWALAEQRIDVLHLERGEYRGSHPGNHTRYDGSAELGFGHDATPFADEFRDPGIEVMSRGDCKQPLRPVAGGGTLAWGALSVRMQGYEFGAWPQVVADQLDSRFYDEAWGRLRVRGVPFPASEPFLRLLQGCLPFHHAELAPVAFGAADNPSPDAPNKFCAVDPLWDLMHAAKPDSRSRRYRLRLKHEVVRLRLSASGREVEAAEVRDLDSGEHKLFEADQYVLAAGPVGSAAIALRSGLGQGDHPGRALVGRGLTDHPVFYRPFEIPYGSTFYEYHRYAKSLAFPSDDKAGSHPYNTVLHIGLVDRLRGHVTSGSRYGEVVFLLDAGLMERNRVTLDDRGRPRVEIDPCEVEPALRRELDDLSGRVIEHLDARPNGRLAMAPLMNVIHHVGSLRMGEGDAGVVDEDLRFGGVDNLHVCDGSVLPSSPAANPGLTIAALALRLSDHLQKL